MINKNVSKIQDWLLKTYSKDLPLEIIEILRNEKIPEKWILAASKIIHRLSEIPWYTQEELLEDINVNKEDLIELNSYIRRSDLLQKSITQLGLGKKYWNTIIPYSKSGYVQKVINYKYAFPLTIAIFPGLSCMFYCGFCGRNQKASYKKNQVLASGIKRFKKIISSLPKQSTISIGGGLEPLTNLRLGEIISHAKSLGHKVPMISNGFSLTKNYIEENPGIWDLDSLRISLYGVDQESTYFITRNKNAYGNVKNNIIQFIKKRNIINPELKLGLNYIIIPENIENLIKLLDYIKSINKLIENGKGINFLTIREDFGSVTEMKKESDNYNSDNRKYNLDELLDQSHREKLLSIFKDFNNIREKELPDLYVDFGYAMESLSKGVLGKPLAKVEGNKMRVSGYPQLCITIDIAGDIYLFREAGFLDRPGNKKFIIGRIDEENTLESILKNFVQNKEKILIENDDVRFMDSYDHLMTLLINQTEEDIKFGIKDEEGPLEARIARLEDLEIDVNNNWYKEKND